jgi:hypothetical protein
MREIDGMTYADLANALDVTVPAVKSLLVRARVGLVEAAEARDADCVEIQADLLRAYDRGVKASGRARKHMRSCDGCTEYRGALRGMRRSFAALSPLGAGPLAFAAKLIGLGGSGAAAAGGGSAAVAGGGAAATMTACKVAAVVCTAALATGGAVEVNHKIQQRTPAAPVPAKTAETRAAQTAPAPAPVVAQSAGQPQVATFVPSRPAQAAPAAAKPEHRAAAKPERQVAVAVPIALHDDPVPAIADDPQVETGGARAPDAPAAPTVVPNAAPAPVAPMTDQAQSTPAPATAGSEQPAALPAAAGGNEAPAPTDAPPPPAAG